MGKRTLQSTGVRAGGILLGAFLSVIGWGGVGLAAGDVPEISCSSGRALISADARRALAHSTCRRTLSHPPGRVARPGDGATISSLPVTPGEYRGTVNQLCPKFAIAAGLCKELQKFPIAFKATAKKISDIRATVLEQCEDNLPPQIVEVEVHRSYRLIREGQDRAHFNIKQESRRRNTASGFVRRQVANGYLSVLSKPVDDPSGEAYCYASVDWKASPQ